MDVEENAACEDCERDVNKPKEEVGVVVND